MWHTCTILHKVLTSSVVTFHQDLAVDWLSLSVLGHWASMTYAAADSTCIVSTWAIIWEESFEIKENNSNFPKIHMFETWSLICVHVNMKWFDSKGFQIDLISYIISSGALTCGLSILYYPVDCFYKFQLYMFPPQMLRAQTIFNYTTHNAEYKRRKYTLNCLCPTLFMPRGLLMVLYNWNHT